MIEVNGVVIEHKWLNGSDREIKESDLEMIADMLNEGFTGGIISYYEDDSDVEHFGEWKIGTSHQKMTGEDDMLAITTDIGKKVDFTENAFREEIRGLISFAVNDKEYDIDEVNANLIAGDLTGILENHGVSQDGLKIIEEELVKYKEHVTKPLEAPLSIMEIRNAKDTRNYVEGVVPVSLSEIIDNDLEGFLDIISEKLVDSPTLMDVQYRIVGHQDEYTVLIKVSGDASALLEDDQENH